jgi:hypothetical protein
MRLRPFWTGPQPKSCVGVASHRVCRLVRARPHGTMSALFCLSASYVS